MKAHGRIMDNLVIDVDAFTASTVGSQYSKLYDMSGYANAYIGVAYGIKSASVATISTITIDLVETSAVTATPTTGAGNKAGIQIGYNSATYVPSTAGAAALILMASSGATVNNVMTLSIGDETVRFVVANEATLSAPSTNWTSTQVYFGPTSVGTTVDGGETLIIDSIRTALQSTIITIGGSDVWRFTTLSTDSMVLELIKPPPSLVNAARHSTTPLAIGYRSTDGCVNGRVAVACGGFEIEGAAVNSNDKKRYVGLKLTSASQAVGVAVTCIRGGGSYLPIPPIGKIST